MSIIRSLPLLLVVVMALPGSAQTRASTIRVLTYNIHHGEGTDGEFDLARLATIIKSVDPDLVALQEVDNGTERAGGLDEMNEFGRLTGLYTAFGKAIDFQGGTYGVGILSRWPILRAENYPLPGTPDREARTALTVEVKTGNGVRLQFTSTHLDQGREFGDRRAQATEINHRLVRERHRPTILAGDMNSGADTEVMQILGSQWTNVSPSDPPRTVNGRPQFRVDYILVRPADRWRVLESTVVDAPVASDHRPVLAVLEWVGDGQVDTATPAR
jgi:endonuclease/exonuclease/phosphatase family metal-dependent hydrolase